MFPSIPLREAVCGPFKRAQLGLFQGKTKQYGNNVPFSKHKTRRTWLPNVQHKRLFSETLGEEVRVKVTTSALRTIKKHGGLDNYVLNTKAELLAWEGMRIRLLVQERIAERQRESQARKASTNKTLSKEQLKEKRIAISEYEDELTSLERPTLADARRAREEAKDSLGVEWVSGKRTIEYLQSRNKERASLLGL